MAYDTALVENQIADILNANAGVWAGAIVDGKRGNTIDSIRRARISSGMEVLRAIAKNPQNSFFGSLMTLVTVAHNAFLPAYDGEMGIPVIVPFSGGTPIDGLTATPGQIDSWRTDPTISIYTGARDGVRVAHNAVDANGQPSPIAARFAIVDGRFKFTGFSAQIPLIQLTRAMADTGVPENYEPTVVKLSIPKLVKEGDNLALIAPMYGQAGMQDLVMIQGGSMQVPPVPSITLAQMARVA